MSLITYYDVLRLDSKCTAEEIKKSYKKMALLFHPDKNPNGLEKFQMIGKAYRCLSNPEKRRRYDEKVKRLHRANRAPEKCPDTLIRLRVSIETLYSGRTRKLSVEREELCKDCRPPCETCGGKGTVTARKIIDVEIEKGVPDGHRIVFLGEGDSKPGCDPGDLIVELVEIEDDVYKRYGSCLCMEVNLLLEEALCGFEKMIQTPDSRQLVISPPRGATTPDGTIRYVENEGMPLRPGSSERGRFVLKFKVHWPEVLEDHTIEQLSQILQVRKEVCFVGTRYTPLNTDRKTLSLYEKMFENN